MPQPLGVTLSDVKKEGSRFLTMHAGAPSEAHALRWLLNQANTFSPHRGEVIRFASLLWPHKQELYQKLRMTQLTPATQPTV
jgi:hypothetical protein